MTTDNQAPDHSNEIAEAEQRGYENGRNDHRAHDCCAGRHLNAQREYDDTHDEADHHCLRNPCKWHPGERHIGPQPTYSEGLIFELRGDAKIKSLSDEHRARRRNEAKAEQASDSLGWTMAQVIAQHQWFPVMGENRICWCGKTADPDSPVSKRHQWAEHTAENVSRWVGRTSTQGQAAQLTCESVPVRRGWVEHSDGPSPVERFVLGHDEAWVSLDSGRREHDNGNMRWLP